MPPHPPSSTLFPYTTLFRSPRIRGVGEKRTGIWSRKRGHRPVDRHAWKGRWWVWSVYTRFSPLQRLSDQSLWRLDLHHRTSAPADRCSRGRFRTHPAARLQTRSLEITDHLTFSTSEPSMPVNKNASITY